MNYLVRLGWSHGDKELFSIDEMIQLFELEKVNVSASTFNTEKLLWLNHQYIMNSDPAHVAHHLSWHLGERGIDPTTGPALIDVVKAQRERCKTLVDMAEQSLYFYRDFEEYDEKAVKKNFKAGVDDILQHLWSRFDAVEDWQPEILHQGVLDGAEQLELNLGRWLNPCGWRCAVVACLRPSM